MYPSGLAKTLARLGGTGSGICGRLHTTGDVPHHLAVDAFKDMGGEKIVGMCSVDGVDHLLGCHVNVLCPPVKVLHLLAMLVSQFDGPGNEIPGLIPGHIPVMISAKVVDFQVFELFKALLKLGIV